MIRYDKKTGHVVLILGAAEIRIRADAIRDALESAGWIITVPGESR